MFKFTQMVKPRSHAMLHAAVYLAGIPGWRTLTLKKMSSFGEGFFIIPLDAPAVRTCFVSLASQLFPPTPCNQHLAISNTLLQLIS
jgi:hypothetical protein